ncbi:cytidylyltransferase domain-containing protein [Metasolibacillus meyeri]|uniref:acylneuraminate cytidylyltransferase family protein n=1 Tax=Metasolibacillus meyeri TaxID=1071052 RepID=UPI000D326D6A|nr:acylneuraminate cytidylyltransferase family protein [Metasolibacillus meyeri]
MKPKILAIIPARGGSKGVPRKNIREIAGKPLLAWTIEEAKKSNYIDRLILSSENDEIIKIAKTYGCETPFIRPLELAQDDTPGIAPVLHAINTLGADSFDFVVLLQPTSPLRNIADIDGCIEMVLNTNSDSGVTVAESHSSPYWMYKMNEEEFLQPLFEAESKISTRQDLPKTYTLNGAVYVNKVSQLLKEKSFIGKKTKLYIMPIERSLDIDNEVDFLICEQLLMKKNR